MQARMSTGSHDFGARYAIVGSPKEQEAWDAAIASADSTYRQRCHNICCDNCHHHTALALKESGRPIYGGPCCADLAAAWLFCTVRGHCTWCAKSTRS